MIVQKILESNKLSISDLFEINGKIYTFINPVSYILAYSNESIYEQFDGIFADGFILSKAIHLIYNRTVERRSFDMTSLAPHLFEYCLKNKKSIHIISSTDKEVQSAYGIFKEKYPGLNLSFRNGFFSSNEERETEINHIIYSNYAFVIIGMGSILQESFLLDLNKSGFKGIGFTCGGFISQTANYNGISYYPHFINKFNLRFLYRIKKEKHTRKRYFVSLFTFPYLFIKNYLKYKKKC